MKIRLLKDRQITKTLKLEKGKEYEILTPDILGFIIRVKNKHVMVFAEDCELVKESGLFIRVMNRFTK